MIKNNIRINTQQGISVLELIISIAIFISVASGIASVVLHGLTNSRYAEEYTVAYQYASEGLEAVKSIKKQSFGNLSASSVAGVTAPSGVWSFNSTPDRFGKYTRTITVSDVQRDTEGNIVSTGGTNDSLTKKITSSVTWEFNQSKTSDVVLSTYLTNWELPVNKKGILVFGDGGLTGDKVMYRLLDSNDGTWSSTAPTADIDTGTTDRYLRAVSVYSSPKSDEKIMLSRHYDGISQYIYAQVFDGVEWGNVVNLSNWSATTYLDVKNFSGTYLSDGNFMAVYSDNSSTPKYRIWDGESWGGQNSLPALSAVPTTIVIDARPGTNEVMFAAFSTNRRTTTAYYNGTSWSLHQFHANGSTSLTKKMVDFAWNKYIPSVGALIFASNSNDKNMDVKIWTADLNGSGSWGRAISASPNQSNNLGALLIRTGYLGNKFMACNKDSGGTPQLICNEVDTDGNWTSTSNTVIAPASQSGIQLSLDVGYGAVAGSAIGIYSDNTSIPKYRVYEAGSWGTPSGFDVSDYSTGTIATAKAYPMSGTYDQIFFFTDINMKLYSVMWDGSNSLPYADSDGKNFTQHSVNGSTLTDFWYDFCWDAN